MLATNIKLPPAPARLLGDMPVGSFLRDPRTTYGGREIVWRVADINHPGYPKNSVTLISYRILTLKAMDAKEPENPTAECASFGQVRYIWSNIRSWANSRAPAGGWYAPAYEYDAPPIAANLYASFNPFDGEAGFLNGFSAKFIASMMPTDLMALVPNSSSDEEDHFTDKIFLPSMAEVGLVNYKNIDEGSRLALFSDNASRIAYPTEYCVSSSAYQATALNTGKGYYWWVRSPYTRGSVTGYFITHTGASTTNSAYYATIGFRPLCNLPAKTRVSLEADADGVYDLFV